VLDYRATSVRPLWQQLPDAVRAGIVAASGAAVAHAQPSAGSGFSGGFAAVLELADRRRVFAKAGSSVNPHLVDAYRQEARILAVLPPAVPAPRFVGAGNLPAGAADEHEWQFVVAEAAAGAMPHPWTEPALGAVHEACLAAVEALTPAPGALAPLPLMVDDYARDATIRGVFPALAAGRLAVTAGQPAWLGQRLAELATLVDTTEEALVGTTACHCDLRADNTLVDGDQALFVDWNWLAVGPSWVDFVGLLPLARLDGVDVETWIARSPLTRDADPEHLDAWLALVAAYMLANADLPLWPGGTPWIRVHQRRYARAFLDWLAARRGWA